jgi:hypothetical protein
VTNVEQSDVIKPSRGSKKNDDDSNEFDGDKKAK